MPVTIYTHHTTQHCAIAPACPYCSVSHPAPTVIRSLLWRRLALSQSSILAMLSPEARAALAQHQQSVRSHERDEKLDEDFGMSQFWYTEAFSQLIAHEALTLGGSRLAGQAVTIVCIACPSVFQQLYAKRSASTSVWLLEYDVRFARYSPFFVHYDLNQPLSGLPPALVHSANCIVWIRPIST